MGDTNRCEFFNTQGYCEKGKKCKVCNKSNVKGNKNGQGSNAPIIRYDSAYANYESATPNCIQVFIDYINTKYTAIGKNNLPIGLSTTDAGNVVENLITLMTYKGFPKINITNVTELYRNFFDTNSFNRKILFDAIQKWADKQFDPPYTAGQMRDKLTISGSSLSQATSKSMPNNETYVRSFDPTNSKKNVQPLIGLTQNEKDFIKALYLQQNPNEPDAIQWTPPDFKFECATCWLCGTYIYIYINKEGKSINICGQDEHIFPPGAGNVFGTLEPSLSETIAALQTQGSISSFGLRPSHAWCNQCKGDLVFINPPEIGNGGKGYSINQNSLKSMLTEAYNWLTRGTKGGTQVVHSYELQFKKIDIKLEPTKAEEFVNNMRTTITNYLNDVCVAANSVSIPAIVAKTPNNQAILGNYNPYTMFLLRLIFRSCYVAAKTLYKKDHPVATTWSSRGGKRKKNKTIKRKIKKQNKYKKKTTKKYMVMRGGDAIPENVQNAEFDFIIGLNDGDTCDTPDALNNMDREIDRELKNALVNLKNSPLDDQDENYRDDNPETAEIIYVNERLGNKYIPIRKLEKRGYNLWITDLKSIPFFYKPDNIFVQMGMEYSTTVVYPIRVRDDKMRGNIAFCVIFEHEKLLWFLNMNFVKIGANQFDNLNQAYEYVYDKQFGKTPLIN